MSDEDFNDDYSEKLTDIQLGFVQTGSNDLFLEADWTKWDGGRVGGKPIWLDKSRIPDAPRMQCRFCQDPMVFLLQIYCPLDDYNETAFHRCLYVFSCKKASCNERGSVQCLRSQLPKENKYYRIEAKSSEAKVEDGLLLCAVCGLDGSFACSKCSSSSSPTQYCCKKHQQIDWKYHKHYCGKHVNSEVDNDGENEYHRNIMFTAFDITIEDENLSDDNIEESTGKCDKDDVAVANVDLQEALKSTKLKPDTVIWEDAVTEGGDDEKADADLKQSDYEKALGNEVSDSSYTKFLSRVRLGGDKQVLRYYCGPRTDSDMLDGNDKTEDTVDDDSMPLPIATGSEIDKSAIPPCQHCGAPRVFEFQVMPQLLHYLKVDHSTQMNKWKCLDNPIPTVDSQTNVNPLRDDKEIFVNNTQEDIDWGSIDVFTCSQSCTPPADSPYVTEFCWRQGPPAVGHQLEDPLAN